MSDNERIVVVTGASRGAGKGIALALGTPGSTVYVTGRTRNDGDAPLPGSVGRTAEEINERGGRGIAVHVDHADDSQVEALFEQIRTEHGRVDLLVNNAYMIHDDLTTPGPFWEKPLDMLQMMDVGLRSSYVASWYAAPLLVNSERGLVVNTSSAGANAYMHGPVYGMVKAGVDKMAHDMAVDFKPHGVAAMSVWMGLLRTERTAHIFESDDERYAGAADGSETPEFVGRVIDGLWRADDLMERSGTVVISAEVGAELGITDIDGRTPVGPRAFLGGPFEYSSAVVQ
ncbi:SDR family NAD(P)-dependent oxidoreductase [Enemella sp. A6]|uniref:SDR family NAD(P)-dependent oxidoreductase n=1 Tax=Enemella sp. A6 TaxID=3440152 RepID=UPI003EB8E728